MTAIQLPFRSNEGRYKFLGAGKLLNAYVEIQGKDAKGPAAILACPGLVEFSNGADTPGRGTTYLEDLNCAYAVHSSAVYKVVEAGTVTRLGTIPGNDQVQIGRNQADPVQISIHCAAGEFYIEDDEVKKVTDEDLHLADDQSPIVTIESIKGHTLYGKSSGRFYLSEIYQCESILSTEYATAEASPDKLVRAKSDGGDVYFFNQRTVEAWRYTGNADFPLEPAARAIQKGLVAPNAVIQLDNSLIFPGEDDIVYRLGSPPQVISTPDISRLLEADANREGVLGHSFSFEGHSFGVLTGSTWTKCYDAAIQGWHDRQSYGMTTWRARNPFRAWGKTIFQDAISGKLLYLAKDTFTEDGSPMIWGGDSPTLHVFPHGAICDAVHFDIATGYGKVTSTEQGFNPLMMLETSVDGGNSFRDHRELSIGQIGDRVRVTARRLGPFGPQGMVFRWRISDPVARGLVNVDVSLRPLKR